MCWFLKKKEPKYKIGDVVNIYLKHTNNVIYDKPIAMIEKHGKKFKYLILIGDSAYWHDEEALFI